VYTSQQQSRMIPISPVSLSRLSARIPCIDDNILMFHMKMQPTRTLHHHAIRDPDLCKECIGRIPTARFALPLHGDSVHMSWLVDCMLWLCRAICHNGHRVATCAAGARHSQHVGVLLTDETSAKPAGTCTPQANVANRKGKHVERECWSCHRTVVCLLVTTNSTGLAYTTYISFGPSYRPRRAMCAPLTLFKIHQCSGTRARGCICDVPTLHVASQ
jgi:hypothetical protein